MAPKVVKIVEILIDGCLVLGKACTKCGEVKSLDSFNRYKRGVGGRVPRCRICTREDYKKYSEANRESIHKRLREKFETDYDKIVARRDRHAEKNRERAKKWAKENREAANENKQRYKKFKKNLPATLTKEEEISILNHFDFKCPFTGSRDIVLDHVIPVSWGHGGTYLGNLIPIDKELNNRKHRVNIFKFAERIGGDALEKFQDIVIPYLSSSNGMASEEYKDFVLWCENNKHDLDYAIENRVNSVSEWESSKKGSDEYGEC